MRPKQNVVFASYYLKPKKVENDYQPDCPISDTTTVPRRHTTSRGRPLKVPLKVLTSGTYRKNKYSKVLNGDVHRTSKDPVTGRPGDQIMGRPKVKHVF